MFTGIALIGTVRRREDIDFEASLASPTKSLRHNGEPHAVALAFDGTLNTAFRVIRGVEADTRAPAMIEK